MIKKIKYFIIIFLIFLFITNGCRVTKSGSGPKFPGIEQKNKF